MLRFNSTAHGHVGSTNRERSDFASLYIPAFIVHETNLRTRRNPRDRPTT
jgi:hypothetical protein